MFMWGKKRTHACAQEIKCILKDVGMLDSFLNGRNCPVQTVCATLHESECHKWSRYLQISLKLRIYITYKTEFCVEPYVYNILNGKLRSVIAQLTVGILPLVVETERWTSIQLKLKVVVGVCNYVIFLANIFK